MVLWLNPSRNGYIGTIAPACMSLRLFSLPPLVMSSYSGFSIVGVPLNSPIFPLRMIWSPIFHLSAIYGMLNQVMFMYPVWSRNRIRAARFRTPKSIFSAWTMCPATVASMPSSSSMMLVRLVWSMWRNGKCHRASLSVMMSRFLSCSRDL